MADEQQQTAEDINDQIRERQRALDEIKQLGLAAYPHKYDRTHSISRIVEEFRQRLARSLRPRPSRSASRARPRHKQDGQGRLHQVFGRARDTPGLHQIERSRRANVAVVQAAPPGRYDRRGRSVVSHAHERAFDTRRIARILSQGHPPAARQVLWAARQRGPLPPAIRRPDCQPRRARRIRKALADNPIDPSTFSTSAVTSRSKRLCSRRFRQARQRGLSSLITTRST